MSPHALPGPLAGSQAVRRPMSRSRPGAVGTWATPWASSDRRCACWGMTTLVLVCCASLTCSAGKMERGEFIHRHADPIAVKTSPEAILLHEATRE